MSEIWGYRRPDGTFGIRNHVAILSVMDNINPIVRQAASLVQGSIPLACGFGRGERGKDGAQQVNTRIGLASNPNVYGVVIVSLEPESAGIIAQAVAKTGKPVEVIAIEEVGGTVKATEQAIRTATTMVADSGRLRREVMNWSDLILGVECGGSDGSSGLVSNPATGLVADRVVASGGTAVLSETVEIIGGENILAKRAESTEVADAFMEVINSTLRMVKARGIDLYNLVPDNIAGGLSTPEEKSLGAIKKGGTGVLRQVLSYGERPSKKGLVFMDAPAPGVENMTALAAGGAQIIIFSTGKGNTIGNPVAPTIKVSGNPGTIKKLADNIDVDLSGVLMNGMSLEDAGHLLGDELINVCNGKLTRAEILGQVEIAISRVLGI